jgi:hypothetical protein
MCAALSYQNISGDNRLTVSFLHTKTLRFAVTTVLGRTNALFVSKKLQTDSEHE